MKKFLIGFITICILICAIPTVAMIARPTTVSTDNRLMASFPSLTTEEGGLNREFFSKFENYYNDHFAFRNELIYTDAMIQSKVFGVSNVDNVTVGKDGWLYYSSTIKDFLGTDNLTDSELYATAHNLALVKEYLDERGKAFLLTIPANKNTLYGEYMPYHVSHKVKAKHNVENLKPLLEEMDIPYVDLVELFRSQDEVLYLKKDSHWNMKGALLAYNAIMDGLELEHDDYSDVEYAKILESDGDLNKMLYTFYGEKESNYAYNIPNDCSFIGEFKGVEDAEIEAVNDKAKGTMLMYRDSFGNTLVPIIANQFSHSWYSRESVYNLESKLASIDPEIIIFEKVERSLSQFMTMPPIITAPEAKLSDPEQDQRDEGLCRILMKTSDINFEYYEIVAELEGMEVGPEDNYYVRVNDKTYKAYYTGASQITIFLRKEHVTFPTNISIIKDGEKITLIGEANYSIEDID